MFYRCLPQGFAATHQLVKTLRPARDMADHPGLYHLPKLLEVGLVEQVEKVASEGQRFNQGPAIASLPLVAAWQKPPDHGNCGNPQDTEDRHVQQEPLRIEAPAAAMPIRDGLEEAHRVIRCSLIDFSRKGIQALGDETRRSNTMLTAPIRVAETNF